MSDDSIMKKICETIACFCGIIWVLIVSFSVDATPWMNFLLGIMGVVVFMFLYLKAVSHDLDIDFLNFQRNHDKKMHTMDIEHLKRLMEIEKDSVDKRFEIWGRHK